MRRVACVALPQIRIEIAREDENVPLAQAAPSEGRGLSPSPRERDIAKGSAKDLALLAVVIARPGGSVGTSRDILGNTRLDVVSREARASGVRAGQTVAAARAKCATLRVRVVAESAVRAGLARVAEVALAFGPSTSFDVATDVVWVEIGGCAHLHGGEGELAQALEGRVRALGHACRVSIADGPRIASAVARFGTVARSRGPRAAVREPTAALIVPEGKGDEAMRALPVEALGLGGEDESLAVWFRDLGLRTCGDLQDLPRRSLGTRLGGAHEGRDASPRRRRSRTSRRMAPARGAGRARRARMGGVLRRSARVRHEGALRSARGAARGARDGRSPRGARARSGSRAAR